MMLKIQNFRCHQNCTYEFLDSKINLISGNSGVGKTTILKAIKWCLFGKIKSVQNKADLQLNPNAKPKCSVTIILEQFTITRSKNPENLTLIKDGVQYDSEVAQSQIDAIFSEHKIWETCCCLDQGLLNSLITGSEKDKIDFLESLSFQQESPEVLIGKIEKAITKTEIESQNLQMLYYGEQKVYSEFIRINAQNINPGYLLSTEKSQELISEISQLEESIRKLELEQQEYNKSMTILETYTSQKDEVLKKLSEVTYVNLETKTTELTLLQQKIMESKKFLEQYTLESKRLQDLKDIKSKLSEIPEILGYEELVKQIDLADREMVTSKNTYNILKQKEFGFLELEKYQTLRSQLRRLPDLSVLQQQYDQQTQLKLQHQQKAQLQEYLQKLETQQKEILEQLSKVPIFDLQQLSDKLQELTKFMEYEPLGLKNNKIIEEIKSLEAKVSQSPTYPKFLETDLQTLESETQIYLQNSTLAQGLGIEYLESIVNQEIENIKYQLGIQSDLQKIKKYQALEIEYNKIIAEETTKEQISELQKQIQLMEASNDVLQCPHCQKYLKLYQQKLISSEQKAYTIEEICRAKEELQHLETQHLLWDKKNRLHIEMRSLEPLPSLNLELYLEPKDIVSRYQRLSQLQNLKVIPAPKFEFLKVKESQKYYQITEEIQELKNKIVPGIPGIDWGQYRAQYEKFLMEYGNAKKWVEFRTALNANLQIVQQKISEVIIPALPAFNLEEYQKLSDELKVYQAEELKYQELTKTIETLRVTYDLGFVGDLKSQLHEIEEKIEVLTQNIHTWRSTKEQIGKYQEHKTLYLTQLQILETQKYEYDQSLIGTDLQKIKDLEIQYSKLSQEITETTIQNNLWNTYNSQFLDLQHKILELKIDDAIPKRLEDNKLRLLELKLSQDRHNITTEYTQKVESTGSARTKCLEIQTRFADLHELKKIAVQTSRECLENTVSQINNDLYHICSNIFDNDIEVLLSLYKQLKSDKEKESVNIFILNKGIKYDFADLSGGQKARLSLALTIALSMISTSPILLLDEVFNSIDAEAREQCFKIIKHYTQKTVIMISHNDILGQYEHVLKL